MLWAISKIAPRQATETLKLVLHSSRDSLGHGTATSFAFMSSSITGVVYLFSFFMSVDKGELFLYATRHVFGGSVPRVLPQGSASEGAEGNVLRLIGKEGRSVGYSLSGISRTLSRRSPPWGFSGAQFVSHHLHIVSR